MDPWESDERITVEAVDDRLEQRSVVRRRGIGLRHPGRWMTAVAALLGLLIAATRLDEGTAPPAASTSRPIGPAAPTSTVGGVRSPALLGPPRPIGSITGIVLYLTADDGPPTSVIAYDVDRGVGHRVELGLEVGRFVGAVEGAGGVVLDAGRVLRLSDGEALPLDQPADGGRTADRHGRVAAGPDGGVWVRHLSPPVVSLFDAEARPTGVQFDLPPGAELFGSLQDGRPVVRGADGRVATVEPSGARPLLASNAVAPVSAGRFAEIRCDDRQQCALVGHIDDREIALGPVQDRSGASRQIEFQTNGPYVALIEDGRLSLLDSETGRVREDIVEGVLALDGEHGRAVAFLPGSAGLAASTAEGVALIGLNGRVRAVLPFTADGRPAPRLLGAGRATPWAAAS